MKSILDRIFSIKALLSLMLVFATSGAWAANPSAEWYGGTYGTASTQFPVQARGTAASASAAQNGFTITKNNQNNTSTADYMMISSTGNEGWPIFIGGVDHDAATVVVGYTLASDNDGTIISFNNNRSGGEGRFRTRMSNGALYAGYAGASYPTWGDLEKTHPSDSGMHYIVMSYSRSGTAGTAVYLDGVKLKYWSNLMEGSYKINQICLGAYNGPKEIIQGIKFYYVAVYNSRLSDDDAFTAYERAVIALNGRIVPVNRSLADGAEVNWSDAEWSVDEMPSQTFTPDSETAYEVTITVGGDCTINMPSSIGSFGACEITFELADGVASADVNLVYPSTTLSVNPSETTHINPFGSATIKADAGITVTPSYGGDATGYKTYASGYDLYLAKRPSVGVVSVRIGARTESASGGYISPAYESVGPYPMSGMFWDQTKFWNNDSTSGNYTDIQNLTDAEDDSSDIRIGYYGHNTYYNTNKGNDASTPNQVLTATYLDDSDSGNGSLTATASVGGEAITLPTPGHNRGWQLHFENIPYSAYDVYFVTASDVNSGLKECPIYVSLDGGTTWKSYMGDSVNEKTVMGTDSWTGLHYAVGGNLVHGKNYIKMRITKSIYGDNIGTIDITHGVRNTGSKIRSGLAAIQIVEVENDGVYTLNSAGDWSDNIWDVGALTGQNWTDTVDGEASIAKIESSATIDSVTVDTAVSAGSVILTGSDDFTVAGSSTLTVETGFDASAFTGALNLQAPITGTIYIGANTSLEFGGDTDMTLPAYTLDGAGAWTKVGTGDLTVNNALALAGTVTGGAVDFTSSTTGNITLNGGNLKFTGGESEILYDGTVTLANNGTGKTIIESGTVQSRGNISTDIDVNNGAVLKLGNEAGFGSSGSAPSGKTITVNSGGVIELNGYEGCNAYTLNGGTLRNTGTALDSGHRQTMGLTLTANSTVHAGSEFGLVNSNHGSLSVALGGYKLTKTGGSNFILSNTTINGTSGSEISVEDGTLKFVNTGSTVNVPVSVAASKTVQVDVASEIQSISGAGSVSGSAMLTTSGLDLSDGLTVATPVTLKNGATVTLGAGSITGAITIPNNAAITFDASGLALSAANADLVTGLTIGEGATLTVTGLASAYEYTIESNKISVYKIAAKIGDVSYLTIADAVEAASVGATIRLMCANSEAAVDTTGKDFIFDENGYAFTGTWTGSGRIVLSAAPSATTWSSSRFVDDGWTGIVALDWANIVSSADLAAQINKYGIAASTVEVGPNGTASGYLNSALTPKFKVNGNVVVANGSSSTQRDMGTVSGSGTLTFTAHDGGYGETTNYSIANLVDWNGALTNASTKVFVTNIVSGRGRVVYNAQQSDTTTAIGADFSGEVEYTVEPANTPTLNANSEATVYLNFNWAGKTIAPYGAAKSTIKLGNLSADNAYFNDGDNSGTGRISSKVVVAGDVTINNGWTQYPEFSWTSGKTVQFDDFTADGSFSLVSTRSAWNAARCYYYIKSLNGDGDGSITVGQGYSLRIDAVDFAVSPSGAGRIVPLTVAAADGTTLATNGELYGADGVLNGVISVTVGGVANGEKLVYATINSQSGLYRAVAQVGTTGYVTMQDAIEAVGDANLASITVLDGTATLPEGYVFVTEDETVVVDKIRAELIVYPATSGTQYVSIEDAINAANPQQSQYVKVYESATVYIGKDQFLLECDDGVEIEVVCTKSAYAYARNSIAGEIYSYTLVETAAEFTWNSENATGMWGNKVNWLVGGESVDRAPNKNFDTVVFNSTANVTVGDDVSTLSSIEVGGIVTLVAADETSPEITATSGIVLTADGASITISGVTLSPTPTVGELSYLETSISEGTTTYTCVTYGHMDGTTAVVTDTTEAIPLPADATAITVQPNSGVTTFTGVTGGNFSKLFGVTFMSGSYNITAAMVDAQKIGQDSTGKYLINNGDGTYTVKFMLDDAKSVNGVKVKPEVKTDDAAVPMEIDSTSDTAKFTVKSIPGLYYAVTAGTTLDAYGNPAGTVTHGQAVQATSASTSPLAPTFTGTVQYYKISVGATADEAEE